MSSLVSVLKTHIANKPDQVVYTFLEGKEPKTLTFAELNKHANNIAYTLLSQGANKGDRVLITLAGGMDYLTAFWGCLYANLIAVPVYPPLNANYAKRTQLIIEDAQAKFMLANNATIMSIKNFQQESASTTLAAKITYIDIVEINEHPRDFLSQEPEATDIAFLQYTSGSTGNPKGVMVRHQNLLANLAMMQHDFAMDEQTHLVSWLPLFHDMGLIGNALQATFLGAQLFLLSPMQFIKDPLIWLRAISKHRGTHTFAPNFSYDLCIAQEDSLSENEFDLSCLKRVINGAEPIKVQTMLNFSKAFKKHRFNPNVWTPGYGLAEVTLYAANGNNQAKGIVIENISQESLEQGHAVLADASLEKVRPLISHGGPIAGQELVIIDPEKLCIQPARAIGEIWLRGAHVCEGYWNKPAINKEIFAAYTSDNKTGPWLRTGDLGYLNEKGELFIIGRCKDLIILYGKKYAPHDFEHTVEECSGLIKSSSVIAFTIEIDQEERLIIVTVNKGQFSGEQMEELGSLVKKRLFATYNIVPHEVLFVEPAGIPKTTSGKLQRQLCKNNYQKGILPIVKSIKYRK